MEKPDEEAVAYFESLVKDESLKWLERLQKMVDWERENRGLLDMLPILETGSKAGIETIAEEMFKVHLSCCKGECEDVTDEVLSGKY